MADSDSPYEVGYGKPPRETRFQKGQSGNRRGRPKGSKNLATVVLRECRQPVHVKGPRGTRTVSKLEAAMMQLGNKSAQGDLRATREFMGLIQRAEESVTTGADTRSLHEFDQQVLESLQRRLSKLQGAGEEPGEEKSN